MTASLKFAQALSRHRFMSVKPGITVGQPGHGRVERHGEGHRRVDVEVQSIAVRMAAGLTDGAPVCSARAGLPEYRRAR